jgi:cytochrome c oxidase subunit 4
MAEHQHPITPVRTYVFVWLALLVGTALTVAAAEVDLKWASTPVAMVIAVTKALLVLYFFMELRHSTRMTVLTAVAGFFWLVLMLSTFMMDYGTRMAQVLPYPGH